MNRREFLTRSGAAAAGLGIVHKLEAKQVAGEPMGLSNCRGANVLMITCHDIGRHLGCYGIDTVNTRNLDRLAADGIRFANYFATDCVCSPSRGSILTGRYPQSNGLMGLTHQPWGWSLKDGERHLAAILKDAGYETTLAGLQHVTSGDPTTLGYENVLSKNRKAGETVSAARQFLRKRKKTDRPFFLKVGFFKVHRPFTVGKDEEKGVFIPHYLHLLGLESLNSFFHVPIDLPHPVKFIGMFAGLGLIIGGAMLIYRRWKNKDNVGANGYADYFFLYVIFFTGLTGMLSWLTRVFTPSMVAYVNYFIHMVFVFMLLWYMPYSKFAHMIYRTLALVYARMIGREAKARV